jgi:hypothetical protein
MLAQSRLEGKVLLQVPKRKELAEVGVALGLLHQNKGLVLRILEDGPEKGLHTEAPGCLEEGNRLEEVVVREGQGREAPFRSPLQIVLRG